MPLTRTPPSPGPNKPPPHWDHASRSALSKKNPNRLGQWITVTLSKPRQWADNREDVRALVLTGSAAAGTEHALSDRDIEVFTTDVPALVVNESWWSELGNILVVERLQDGEGNPTRLA